VQAFDAPEPGLEYKHRWAAFGIAEGANGTIALVEVRKPGRPPYFDLPGGAVDGDEDEHAAVAASSARRPAWSSRSGRG
jgi:8-oxo-dGTP diphosphatase